MDRIKYIGMDVHKATNVMVVLNGSGRVVTEAIIENKAAAILDFIKSQRGTLWVTLEEGTYAAWLSVPHKQSYVHLQSARAL